MGISRKPIEKNMYFGAKVENLHLALKMRREPTEAENALWNILRKYRHSGFTFRRQHPIEFYIADFYCHKLKLVVEVDGEIHSEEEVQNHGEGRTGELERLGITVLRFTNHMVLAEIDKVTEKLNSLIKELS
jgi:very-short-patch-repair endonuclease